MTWARAGRAAALAVGLIAAVLFCAGNFVLVDVRFLGVTFDTRVAWVGVVPALLGFALGMLYARARARA